MKEIKFFDGYRKPIALALGFFDSIHIGHQKLIEVCREKAEKFGCESAIMTFDNNPFVFFRKGAELVYNYEERVKILSELGLDCVIHQTFDGDFMKLTPAEFLKALKNLYDIKHVVCGEDYTFGSFPQGKPKDLKEFFEGQGVSVSVISDVLTDGVKASSTLVRERLVSGDIRGANKILGLPYRVSGLVERGHSVGQGMGYPTANIKSPQAGALLRPGVYSVFCVVNGVRYEGAANAGTRPTFGENVFKVETHLINFSGDLYGSELTVYFKNFIRDIKKFASREQLSRQILEDIEKSYDK